MVLEHAGPGGPLLFWALIFCSVFGELPVVGMVCPWMMNVWTDFSPSVTSMVSAGHLTLCPTHVTAAAPQAETFISSQIGLLIHTPQLITLGQAPLTFLLISSYLKRPHVVLDCCLEQSVYPAAVFSLPELV